MVSKYISLEEETSGYGTHVSSTPIFVKILSEDISTQREDYFVETTDKWAPPTKIDGFFRGGGTFTTMLDPLIFPKFLVFFMGDGSSYVVSSLAYTHRFYFGGNETTATKTITSGATVVKSFTMRKGVGIEKDRMFHGGYFQTLEIEAVGREVVSVIATVVHNGHELLVTAATPDYTKYSAGLYFTFDDASTMNISSTSRLTTAPVIEAFRLTLTRGTDTDHFRLGSKYLAGQTFHGVATVEGSMDFGFTSQDEHERFLNVVGGTETGDQASFAIQLLLRNELIGTETYQQVQFDIPKSYYTVSENAVVGRDRIIQTVNYKGVYDSDMAAACRVSVTNNATSAYYVIP